MFYPPTALPHLCITQSTRTWFLTFYSLICVAFLTGISADKRVDTIWLIGYTVHIHIACDNTHYTFSSSSPDMDWSIVSQLLLLKNVITRRDKNRPLEKERAGGWIIILTELGLSLLPHVNIPGNESCLEYNWNFHRVGDQFVITMKVLFNWKKKRGLLEWSIVNSHVPEGFVINSFLWRDIDSLLIKMKNISNKYLHWLLVCFGTP